ncbi:MAG: VOC family protein [Spirochaetota bacterium]
MNIEFHHICIETDDYKESLAFYTKAMGFHILEEKRDFHGRDFNTWIRNGSVIIELQTPKIAGKELPSLGNRGIRHV